MIEWQKIAQLFDYIDEKLILFKASEVNAQDLNDPSRMYQSTRLGVRKVYWCPSGYGNFLVTFVVIVFYKFDWLSNCCLPLSSRLLDIMFLVVKYQWYVSVSSAFSLPTKEGATVKPTVGHIPVSNQRRTTIQQTVVTVQHTIYRCSISVLFRIFIILSTTDRL